MVKSPSFIDLKPASEASSRAKRHNRRTDTQHERMLRRELWRMGLRDRKNVETLPGKPDIVFVGARLAVFAMAIFGMVEIGMFCGRNSHTAPMRAIGWPR